MSLQSRLADLVVAIGTDYKQLRTWITGSSSGSLASLATSDKTSLINAINEVKAGNTGSPAPATTSVQGVAEVATLAEVAAGTDNVRFVTPEGVRQERTAVKNEILGGVGPAFDTLQELSAQLSTDEGAVGTLTTLVGTKQDSSTIGNPDADLVAAYAAAKA